MAMIEVNPVFFPGEENEKREFMTEKYKDLPASTTPIKDVRKGSRVVTKKGEAVKKPKKAKMKKAKVNLNKTYSLPSFKTNNWSELERIQKIVCKAWQVDEQEIPKKNRMAEVKTARQLIMYFGYISGSCNYHFIGRFVKKDHATVIHGVKIIENLLSTDHNFREHVSKIHKKIKGVPTEEEKVLHYNWEVFNEVKSFL
jgi:hypothetical protein